MYSNAYFCVHLESLKLKKQFLKNIFILGLWFLNRASSLLLKSPLINIKMWLICNSLNLDADKNLTLLNVQVIVTKNCVQRLETDISPHPQRPHTAQKKPQDNHQHFTLFYYWPQPAACLIIFEIHCDQVILIFWEKKALFRGTGWGKEKGEVSRVEGGPKA